MENSELGRDKLVVNAPKAPSHSSSVAKNFSRITQGINPARQSTFFINGDGIDREVITTDICRYLGNDAVVRPGIHQVRLSEIEFY
jgi:hypothetical protein